MLAIGLLLCCVGVVWATETSGYKFVRIGTGGSGGAYLPIGTVIAKQFNKLKSVLAVSQRSRGSVANLQDITDGLVEVVLSHSDIVHSAFHGEYVFKIAAQPELRSIATLYLESAFYCANR